MDYVFDAETLRFNLVCWDICSYMLSPYNWKKINVLNIPKANVWKSITVVLTDKISNAFKPHFRNACNVKHTNMFHGHTFIFQFLEEFQTYKICCTNCSKYQPNAFLKLCFENHTDLWNARNILIQKYKLANWSKNVLLLFYVYNYQIYNNTSWKFNPIKC